MKYRTLEELMGVDAQDVSHAEILDVINMITTTQLEDAKNLEMVVPILQGILDRLVILENRL